ncbi:odorant receptor 4-like isoform X5 [Vespula squamosa]|uniref:Odorant receptor n=1 Tax=Vespula squamosa TaxID=30214 RepID=A0ABD2BE67_VESSQ
MEVVTYDTLKIQTRKRNLLDKLLDGSAILIDVGERCEISIESSTKRVVRQKGRMFPKKSYDDDLRYAIEPNRYVLLSLGIRITCSQVNKRESFLVKSLRLLLIFLNFVIILYVVIPGFLHIFLKETSTYGKIRVIQPILYSSMALAKYTVLVFCIERMNVCLKYVSEDWKNAVDIYTRDTMKKKAMIGRRFFIICGSLMYGSGILFRGIIPLIKGKITINENFTIRPLPCPCYFLLFDPQLSPAYEIVYFLQCLSGMVTYSITTAICGLAAFLIMHICGQLEILVTLMDKMVEKTNPPSENVHAKIALAVEHQIRVRRFLRAVEHTLQQICLIEIMGCTLMVCMLAYNIMTEWTNRNIAIVFMYSIALSSIICNIFILCYIGEQLTLQAEKVARKSCTLDWYNLPPKKLSGLVLMIAISNRPMKITAGNIVELSLQTFGNVIKTAATYCNMLRAVTT